MYLVQFFGDISFKTAEAKKLIIVNETSLYKG